MGNIKQYEFDFGTKKATEITQAPSYISADIQEKLAEELKKLSGNQHFVYFWKKSDREMGAFVTDKKMPDRVIPSIIEDNRRAAMHGSMSEDFASLFLELELAASLMGLLNGLQIGCTTCRSTTCPKSPQYKK